ncbi:hypothetical protein pb186bvf_002880 [Paramecium bursaria]
MRRIILSIIYESNLFQRDIKKLITENLNEEESKI